MGEQRRKEGRERREKIREREKVSFAENYFASDFYLYKNTNSARRANVICASVDDNGNMWIDSKKELVY